MHSDEKGNVKATWTELISIKEHPGALRTITQKQHFLVMKIKSMVSVVGQIGANGDNKLLSENNPLKEREKNYKPYPSVFSKQPYPTLPYVY